MIAGLAALWVCMLGMALAAAQTGTAEKPVMSDEFFKNVQLLKGISVDEFLDTMGMFAASTGLTAFFP